MKQQLITTGLNGLVGSTLAEAFADIYEFENLDISNKENPVDITNLSSVQKAFEKTSAEVVIHLAAFTDVTKAWEQRGDKNGLAYKVNVEGTKNIVQAAKETGKHLINISTAFVFDGTKEGLYTEEDNPNPIEWYGQTKYEAEQVIATSASSWTTLRIDFPFREQPFPKPDIVRKSVAAMEKGYPLFEDHSFGPTYLEDLAKVIDWFITHKEQGLFHASSGEQWNDFQLGSFLNKHHGLGFEVKKGSLTEYLKTNNRPYQKNTALDVSKLLATIDFSLTPIQDALQRVTL